MYTNSVINERTGEEILIPMVWSQMTVHAREKNYEPGGGEDKTIPDQTMSMREILDRYAKGISIGGAKEPIFDEDGNESSGINVKKLDLVDLQELQMENNRKIKSITNEIKNRKELRKAVEEAEKVAKQSVKNVANGEEQNVN